MKQDSEFLLRSYIEQQVRMLQEAEKKEDNTGFLKKIQDPTRQDAATTTPEQSGEKNKLEDETSDKGKITQGNKASEKVKKKIMDQKPVRPEDFENVGRTRVGTADVLNFLSDQMKGKGVSNVQALGDVIKVQRQNMQGSSKPTTDTESTKGTKGTKLTSCKN